MKRILLRTVLLATAPIVVIGTVSVAVDGFMKLRERIALRNDLVTPTNNS